MRLCVFPPALVLCSCFSFLNFETRNFKKNVLRSYVARSRYAPPTRVTGFHPKTAAAVNDHHHEAHIAMTSIDLANERQPGNDQHHRDLCRTSGTTSPFCDLRLANPSACPCCWKREHD